MCPDRIFLLTIGDIQNTVSNIYRKARRCRLFAHRSMSYDEKKTMEKTVGQTSVWVKDRVPLFLRPVDTESAAGLFSMPAASLHAAPKRRAPTSIQGKAVAVEAQ